MMERRLVSRQLLFRFYTHLAPGPKVLLKLLVRKNLCVFAAIPGLDIPFGINGLAIILQKAVKVCVENTGVIDF